MQIFLLSILTLLYLGASVRYYPGSVQKTLVETAVHIISIAPFAIGCTMLIVIMLQKVSQAKLPWDRVARIFLILALFLEVILGFQNYVGQG